MLEAWDSLEPAHPQVNSRPSPQRNNGYDPFPGQSRQRESSKPAASTNFTSLLQELAHLASLMRDEVIDKSTGKLSRDVSLREARETLTASANLLSLIARNQELTERAANIAVFQNALVIALGELDSEMKGNFLQKFDNALESLLDRDRAA